MAAKAGAFANPLLRPALKLVALALTHGNKEAAEDLVQECALATCQHFADYNESQAFDKWASCILYNLFVDSERAYEKRKCVSLSFRELNKLDRVDPNAFTEDCFAICDAIDRLPEEPRQHIREMILGEPSEERREVTARWRARQMLKEALF